MRARLQVGNGLPKFDVRPVIQKAIADSRILYFGKKRSLAHLAVRKGANYPTAARKAGFTGNILRSVANVKYKSAVSNETALFSVSKKSMAFLTRFKTRHIFRENSFSQKISLRSSKSLTNQAFLMAIYPIRGGPCPLELPCCCMTLDIGTFALIGFSTI